jgi:hypothetical protein
MVRMIFDQPPPPPELPRGWDLVRRLARFAAWMGALGAQFYAWSMKDERGQPTDGGWILSGLAVLAMGFLGYWERPWKRRWARWAWLIGAIMVGGYSALMPLLARTLFR